MRVADRSSAREYAAAAGMVAAVSLAGLLFRARLATIDVAMVYLLAVVAVSSRYRRGPAILASILSILSFDFWFVPPYNTLHVRDSAYLLTFGVMLVVALTMTRLTARIREQREVSAESARRTAVAYQLERDLASAADREAIRGIAARHLETEARGAATIVYLDELASERGVPVWPDDGPFQDPTVRLATSWVYEHGEPAGWCAPHAHAVEPLVSLLQAKGGPLGLVVLTPDNADARVPDGQCEFVLSLIGVVAGAVERCQLAEHTAQARSEAEAERLRTALLSSLSHDLRTPLASIEGAASSMLQQSSAMPDDVRDELLQSIVDESHRMTRLVSNLLDMIRVETGTLAVQKSWQPLEEPLGVVLLRMEDALRVHPVTTRIPADLPLIAIDELLIEQVLINLLENAVRYTPPGTPIEIAAERSNGAVLVEVLDRGPGIPSGQEEMVFRRFHRIAPEQRTGGGGSGLGLTICRGIITAHGGRIWLERREGGGAAFRFTIPLNGPAAPEVPAELLEHRTE